MYIYTCMLTLIVLFHVFKIITYVVCLYSYMYNLFCKLCIHVHYLLSIKIPYYRHVHVHFYLHIIDTSLVVQRISMRVSPLTKRSLPFNQCRPHPLPLPQERRMKRRDYRVLWISRTDFSLLIPQWKESCNPYWTKSKGTVYQYLQVNMYCTHYSDLIYERYFVALNLLYIAFVYTCVHVLFVVLVNYLFLCMCVYIFFVFQ